MWVKYNDGRVVWEVLPEWVASFVLLNLPYEDAARAMLYRRLSANAPDDVVRLWLKAHLGGMDEIGVM